MTALRFIPIGVGDAFSSRSYSSSIALGCGDAWLLIDCPHPIRKVLGEAGAAAGIPLDVGRFEAVVLTHLHADHASGLEDFGYFSHFVLGRRARLLCHPSVSKRLWEGHLAAGMERLIEKEGAGVSRKGLDDFFVVEDLSLTAAAELGPFSIEARMTVHHIPTTALRIRAGGRVLGFSADTAFDEGLIDWLAEADLVIHETNYGAHTPYEKLAALPADVRAKMRLIHYPDDFDLAASVIEPLRPGRIYRV